MQRSRFAEDSVPLWARRLYGVADSHPAGWPEHAARVFERRMLDEGPRFPCVFGVDATRRGTLRLAFVPAGAEGDGALADALEEFARVSPSLGNRTSLVCLFEPDPGLRSIHDYRNE